MLSPRPLPDHLPSLVTLDPEEESLLRGCLACPWDDAVFLVYADWLEEHHHTERANFVRRQLRQGGQCYRWHETPRPVQTWARAVFPEEVQQRLCFARGLPGILYVENARIGELSSPALAGWIWGIRNNGKGFEMAQRLTSSPLLVGLTWLDLGHNAIGDVGAQALAVCSHLVRLTHLALWNNEIGDTGAQALAAGPRAGHLTSLDLRYNWIGDTGAQALATSPHLARLTCLDLSVNSIGAEGRQALRQSASLRECKIIGID
jgi:uncharacterized protein (TIGR02996 family)